MNRKWNMKGTFENKGNGKIEHRLGLVKWVNKSGERERAISDIKKENLNLGESLWTLAYFPYIDKDGKKRTGSFYFIQYNNTYSYIIFDYNSTATNRLDKNDEKVLAEKENIKSINEARENLKNDLFKIGFKDTSKPDFEGLILSDEDLLDFQPIIDDRIY